MKISKSIFITVILLISAFSSLEEAFAQHISNDRNVRCDSVWYHDGKWYSQTQLDSAIEKHEKWLLEFQNYLFNKYDINQDSSDYYKFFKNLILRPSDSTDSLIVFDNNRLQLPQDTISTASIKNVDLSGCILYKVIIANSDFYEVNFHGSLIMRTNCYSVQFKSCNFTNTFHFFNELNNVDFVKCNFNKMDLEGNIYDEVSITNSFMREVIIMPNKLLNFTLESNDYEKLEFKNAEITNPEFDSPSSFIFDNVIFFSTDFKLKDLSLSKFLNVELQNVDFRSSNLKGVVYEPAMHPNTNNIAFAKNLDDLTCEASPQYLVELKDLLKKDGFVKAAKQVNAAIKRHSADSWEKWLFDYTCEYGSNPILPLMWILRIVLICALCNFITFTYKGKGGIAFRSNISIQDAWNEKWQSTRIGFTKKEFKGLKSIWVVVKYMLYAIGVSFVFSTRFGFRDFSLANWVKRLFPFEFDIRSRGWIRVVHGIQSLLSIYMFFLFIVSYFTNIFDIG